MLKVAHKRAFVCDERESLLSAASTRAVRGTVQYGTEYLPLSASSSFDLAQFQYEYLSIRTVH